MKHLSAMGKMIDMSAIRVKNEHVRALGNMGINARGDLVDSNGGVISDSLERVGKLYSQTLDSGVARPPQPAPSPLTPPPPQSTPVEAEHTLPDTLVVTEPQSVIVHQQAQPDDPHTSANIPKSLDKPRKSR